MKPTTARRLRILGLAVAALLLLSIAAAGWFYRELRASLPRGTRHPVRLVTLSRPDRQDILGLKDQPRRWASTASTRR